MLSLIAFTVCSLLILGLRPVCVRFNHVDHPGGHKLHADPTPLCGGGAIVLTFFVLTLIIAPSWEYVGLLLGLLIMVTLGAVDDRRDVRPTTRLGIQALAVGVGFVFLGGLQLENLGALITEESAKLHGFAPVFTVIATIGVINAINMIDGIDGLAGGFAFLVLALFAALVPLGSLEFSYITIALGGVAGFLAFNLRTPWRRRASIFLGDAGSLSLGLLLVWFAISLSQGSDAALRPIAVVWIFGLPLMDTGYLMVSRAVRGQNPMRADRNHFHHILQMLGLTPGKALYVWLFVAASFMGIGIAGEALQVDERIMCGGFLALFLVYSIFMLSVRRGRIGVSETG